MAEEPKEGEAPEEDTKKYRNLTDENLEEIDEIFEMFDKDRDGLISFFDLTNMLRWLQFNPTEREMRAYEEKYDAAKQKQIKLTYIKEIVDMKMSEPDTIEELIEAMKVLDNNKDGTIPVPELRWAMSKLGDPLDDQTLDEMIKEIDSDGKGYVDILEFAKITFNIKEKKPKD